MIISTLFRLCSNLMALGTAKSMLGPDYAHLCLTSLLFVLNLCDRRIYSAGKESRSVDQVSKRSELRSAPGVVVLYSKQSTKVDFITDKLAADHSDVSSRIVNHVPNYQSLDSSHNHHKHGGPKPKCAKDLPYCLYNEEYPIDTIHEILNNYHDDMHHLYNGMNLYPPQEYIKHDNFSHSYRHKGSFVCESEVSYIRPGWARNWKNEWVAVVNTEKYPQSIRVETCKYSGKKCEYLPPCYKSFCVQRYTYVKLLCVDPYKPHHRPVVDVLEVPTACSCFVENFVYY